MFASAFHDWFRESTDCTSRRHTILRATDANLETFKYKFYAMFQNIYEKLQVIENLARKFKSSASYASYIYIFWV